MYAIGDVAFCLGFAIGPALSGTLGRSGGKGELRLLTNSG